MNKHLFVPARCQCGYCEHCKNDAIVYDECLGCYDGIHPHLPQMQFNFENYMKTTLHSKDISHE